MGEIAEMMLDGTLCECCGGYIDDDGAHGIPRYCSPQCAKDRGAATGRYDPNTHRGRPSPPRADKTNCPQCNRRVKIVGLADHIRDAHATAIGEAG